MDRQTSLDLLADRLEFILSDAGATIDNAGAGLPADVHPDVRVVLNYVWHWTLDGDIRARDAGYREMQESQMRGLIEALRRGAPREELRTFTFLRP